MTEIPIKLVAETDKTITIGWTPTDKQEGYLPTIDGSETLIDGKRHPGTSEIQDSVRIGKPADETNPATKHKYGVKILGEIAQGTYASVPTTPPPTTPPPTGQGKLIFEDDFSNGLAKWEVGWFGGPGPVNSAEAAGYKPDHLKINGGNLEMLLTKDPISTAKGEKPYTGALLTTQKTGLFKTPKTGYRFEARMYLPGVNGQVANWPAFWSNGNAPWPTNGENDVMEGLGGDASFHYHSPSGGPGGDAPGSFGGDWHTFASEVNNGVATYFYDGKKVGSISQIVEAPHYLILQQSISDHHPEVALAPATVAVDYVRVWQL